MAVRKTMLMSPIAMLNKDATRAVYTRSLYKRGEKIVAEAVAIARKYDDENKIHDYVDDFLGPHLRNEKDTTWDLQSITAAIAVLEKDWDKIISKNKGTEDFQKRLATAMTSMLARGMEIFVDDVKKAEVAGHLTTGLDRLGGAIAGRRIKKQLE